MAGRKRKPKHLHLVQGTARKSRLNPNEPAPPVEPPRAPEWISRRASEWFGILRARLESMGMASAADTENLMIAALRLEEIELRDADIRENGAVYLKIEMLRIPALDDNPATVKPQKVWKSNPAVAQRSEAMRHLQALLADFGLSPASRGKVSAQPKPKKNSWADFAK